MESILRRTEVELGTLNPPAKKFPVFSSYVPRRSHLDSETYRTLVCIFSHCVELSSVSPPPPPEITLCVRKPTSSHESCLERDEGSNINDETPIERHMEGGHGADDGDQERSLVSHAELAEVDLYDTDDNIEECVNNQMLSRVMSDCKRLIDSPNGDLCLIGESYEGSRQVGHEEAADKELDIPKVQFCCAMERVSELGDASEDAKEVVIGESFSNFMPDVDRIICAPNMERYSSEQSQDVNKQAGHDVVVNNDMQNPKSCVHGLGNEFFNLCEVSDVAKDDVNSKMVSSDMPNCGRSNDAPDGELHSSGELNKVNEQAHVKVAEKGFEITKARVHDVEKGSFILGEVSATVKEDVDSKLHCTPESRDEKEQSSHEVIQNNDIKIAKTSIHGVDEGIYYAGEVSKFAVKDVDSELHNQIILDCCRLIDAPSVELQSINFYEQTGHEEIVDNDMKISKPCAHSVEEGISPIGEVLEVANGDALVKVQSNASEMKECSSMKKLVDKRERETYVGNLLSKKPRKSTNDEMPFLDETKNKNSIEVDEKILVTEQPTSFSSTSLMDCSEMKIMEEEQRNSSIHPIDEGEFEEGEIPDEIQNLEGPIDILNKERVEGQKRIDFNEQSSTKFIHTKDVHELQIRNNQSTVQGSRASVCYEAKLSDVSEKESTDEESPRKKMVMKTREKKQRSRLTEERKAKKKIAKKRKRAQKNREQGVKKLKLHAVMKPKEIKICNFYLKGRCQQGDLCKYSHDAPLEKTVPCKYFACNSCLKGDDCMYDHDLSKYPCHNFASTGNCIRGDGCKFSHKITSTDTSSQLTSSILDSGTTYEQSKLRSQPMLPPVSPLDKGSFESYNKGTPSSRHQPLKETNQVPKGIRFLSFGVAQMDLTNKVKESLPVKKPSHNGAYILQKQDDLLAHRHQHNAFTLSSGLLSSASSNGFTLNDSGNITKGFSISSPKKVNHEISEASKILEEFLFCGPI